MPVDLPQKFATELTVTGSQRDHKMTNGDVSGTTAALQKFFLDNPSIRYVRYQWTDISGQVRARIATKAWALRLVNQDKPIIVPSPITTAITIAGPPLFELLQLGNDELWPQWETLRVAGYADGHAAVMCHVRDCGDKLKHGFELDARSTLKRKLAEIKENHGLEFLVGYEIEFMFLDKNPKTGEEEPFETDGGLWNTASYRNKCSPILEEILDVLNDSGIEVRQYHSEGASGMFEISTEPLPPLEAVDALMFTQETVKGISYKHGLRATMHPTPFEGKEHIGLHTHFSIVNCKGEEVASSFTAGLLASLPGLLAIGMPNYLSYARADFLNGWVMWAWDFKGVPIRRIRPDEDYHWELRFPDAMANHYWLLTAVLGVGSAAVAKGMELAIKPRSKASIRSVEKEEREECGIKTRIPTTNRQSIEALEEDEAIKQALGEALFERFVYNKNKEEEAMKGMGTEGQRRAATMKLF